MGDEETDSKVLEFLKLQKKKPKLDFNMEDGYLTEYVDFYKKIMAGK